MGDWTKSNWCIQLTSIRSTPHQAWLNLLFMTICSQTWYTSEWGEFKIQIPKDGPMGSVFLISPQVQPVLGLHSGTIAELTSHHSGPGNLNLPSVHHCPIATDQAFIRPLLLTSLWTLTQPEKELKCLSCPLPPLSWVLSAIQSLCSLISPKSLPSPAFSLPLR